MAGKRDITLNVGYNVDDKQFKSSISDIKKSLQDIQNTPITNFAGASTELLKIKDTAKDVQKWLTDAFNVKLNSVNIDQFNQALNSSGRTLGQIQADFAKMGQQGKTAFNQLATSVLSSNLQLKETHSILNEMGTTMMNTVKWGVASSIMNTFTGSVQQAFQYVKSLDSALTDIRIVTGDSTDQMAKFADQANRAAQQLGRSTMDYSKAALTFYQQGLSDEDVQARTEATLKAQNITGAGQEMADYLTAVWNGYKVANEEAELYVDKLAAVADSSASNMSQLAVAMSKVASTANALGVPVDSLNAQIATIVATTRQAPESVGNALKTIYARINDIATGADDAQISLGNYSEKMAELGFSVLDANGNLRDTGDVIEQIGGKWADLSREQQIYLARTMAGQRQYNNLIALFDNWSRYTDLVTVSMDSQGATMEKNSRYMESLEAHMEQLGAAGQRLKSSLIDSDSFKGLIDAGTQATQFLANFIESIGGGGNALLALGSTATSVFSGVISKQINNLISNFQAASYNAQQLKADIELTKSFGAEQGFSSKAIDSMVALKTEVQQYYKILSTQQVNEYQQLVKNVGMYKTQQQHYKNLANLSQSLIDVTKGKDLEIINLDGKKETFTQFQEFINRIVDLRDELKTVPPQQAVQNFKALGGAIEEVIGPEKFKQLGNGKQSFAELNYALENNKITTQQFEHIINTVINRLKEVSPEQLEKLKQAWKKNEEAANNAQKAAELYLKQIKQMSNIQTFTKMIAGIGQVASGLNSLINITKIWQNQSLSTGEKILQTLTSFSMGIGMLASGFNNLIPVIVKVFGSAIVGANGATLAQVAAVAATQGWSVALKGAAVSAGALMTALWPLLVGGLVIAGIAGIVAIFDKLIMSTKQATQAIDKFRQKQDQLNQSIKKYAQNKEKLGDGKQWQQLREKAGAYNQTINTLTEEEKTKYYELSNLIAEYNNAAVIGYDQQGNAIIDLNHDLEETIALLKEKHKLEIQQTYGSKQAQQARRGEQVLYQDTKKNLQNAQQNYYNAFDKEKAQDIGIYNANEFQYNESIDRLKETLQGLKNQAEPIVADEIQNYINDLDEISKEGFQKFAENRDVLSSIINDISEIARKNNFDLNESAFSFGKEALIDLNNQFNQYQKTLNQLNQEFKEAGKIDINQVLGLLQLDGDAYDKAKEAGSFAVDSILKGYIEGLNLSRDQDYGQEGIYGYAERMAKNALQKISDVLYNTQFEVQGKDLNGNPIGEKIKQNLEGFILSAGEGFDNLDFNNIKEKKEALSKQLSSILTQFPQLQQLLATAEPALRESILQFIANAFHIEDLDFNLDKMDFEIPAEKAVQELMDRIREQIDAAGDGKGHSIGIPLNDLQVLLPDDFDASKIDQVKEKFSEIYSEVGDVNEALRQSIQEVQNLSTVTDSINAFGNVNAFAAGDFDSTDDRFVEMKSQLQDLVSVYPRLQGAVQVLTQEWMQGTSLYENALYQVNAMLLNTMEASVQAGTMTVQQVSSQVRGMISNSQTLQQVNQHGLLITEDYIATLGTLASQYQSCSNQLDRYLLSIQSENELEQHAAEQDLQLAVRSAENAQTYGIQAERISDLAQEYTRLAEAGVQEYEGLDKGAQIAVDAATRYIRLNDAVADLYDNMEDYSQMLKELNSNGIQSVIANDDMYQSYNNLKSTIADLLDTSEDFIDSDFMKNSADQLAAISEGGEQAEEALKEMQARFAEQIFVKLGVDTSALESELPQGYNSVAQWASSLPEGELKLDDTVFLNKLVWAMQQAGMAEIQIESALSGIGIDVDLVPYTEGLNAAIDEAYQASDALVDASSIDTEMVTEEQTSPQSMEIPQQDYTIGEVHGTVLYPMVTSMTAGAFDGRLNQGTFVVSVPTFIPKKQTEVVEGQTKSVGTALMATNGRKKAGGNIGHSNKKSNTGSGGGKKGGGGGKKGSSPKSSSGSSKQPTQVKQVTSKIKQQKKEAPFNPYQQVDKEYQRQSNKLDQLQQKQKKLVNKDRLNNLKQQNKELEKQAKILKEKLDISNDRATRNTAAWYASEIEKAFKNVKFDFDGQIADRNALQRQAVDIYNANTDAIIKDFKEKEKAYNDWILNVYNAASAEQQENLKAEKQVREDNYKAAQQQAQDAIKKQQQRYQQHTKLLDNYQKQLQMQKKIKEELEQIHQQQIENNIAASKIIVDLSLDTGQFERKYLDFENKFIKKIDKKDYLGKAKASVKELMSYFNSEEILKTKEQIDFINEQINRMKQGVASDTYGLNMAQAQQDLQHYTEQLMDSLQDAQDLVEDIKDLYLDAIDNAKDQMDQQIEQYQRVGDLIEHNMKLTQLIYGDKAYDAMNKYYDLQRQNDQKSLESLRQQQKYWLQQMNNQIQGSDAWKAFKENYQDATDEIGKKMQDMLGNLADKFANQLQAAVDKVNKKLTGGLGTDYLEDEWDLVNNFDDKFLDPIESKMGIDDVSRVYEKAINQVNGNPKAQRQLNSLMQKQMKLLREKDHLTEYDLERAKASLEVEKARLALEQARDNKTKMRLRRDSQGNYTYQYVADEQKLSDLQAALADAQANLYNTDKQHYKQNLDDLYETFRDYVQKMTELEKQLSQAQTEQDKKRILARREMIQEQLGKRWSALYEDNGVLKDIYLPQSVSAALGVAQEIAPEILSSLSWFGNTNQGLADQIDALGGLIPGLKDTLQDFSNATQEFLSGRDKILETGGTNAQELLDVVNKSGKALDTNIAQAEKLTITNEKLFNSIKAQVGAMQALVESTQNYLDNILDIQDTLLSIRGSYNTLQELNNPDKNSPSLTADNIPMTNYGLDTTKGSINTNVQDYNYTGNPLTDTAAIKQQLGAILAQYEKYLQDMAIAKFDTGGATGSWGDAEGRLAFLHEKQLVLNQEDTLNILKAVQAVRIITGSLTNFADNGLAALMNDSTGLLSGLNTSETLDQNVHIEANFPNVREHTEIEQAFNNLVNIASMHASRYRD